MSAEDGLAQGQPYADATKPGRVDVNGVEWWACDPYPTWFRWEGDTLYTNPARFADEADHDTTHAKPPEECYGHDNHAASCDQIVKARRSGVRCDCGARWYCL